MSNVDNGDKYRVSRKAGAKGTSEFGGGGGAIQRFPDGSDKELKPGEAARVVRMAGMQPDLTNMTTPRPQKRVRGRGVLGEILGTTGVESVVEGDFEHDVEALERLREKTADYSDNAETYSEPTS